jgi:uncharacterized membrane protein
MATPADAQPPDHLRHLDPTKFSAFGGDSFGRIAERIARFFGTPKYIVGQTIVVLTWVVINATGLVHFDVYPFILLNLAFSLQAAYAAPLILLAQTRQADRERDHAVADAKHREELAAGSVRREQMAQRELHTLHTLIEQNTDLTQQNTDLARKIEELTERIHDRVSAGPGA